MIEHFTNWLMEREDDCLIDLLSDCRIDFAIVGIVPILSEW